MISFSLCPAGSIISMPLLQRASVYKKKSVKTSLLNQGKKRKALLIRRICLTEKFGT
jgi:hypothetical protein